MAGDAQGNRLAGGEETLPGEGGEALLKLGEGSGVEEIAQAGKDAGGGAQMEVGAIEGSQVTAEEDAAGVRGSRGEVGVRSIRGR